MTSFLLIVTLMVVNPAPGSSNKVGDIFGYRLLGGAEEETECNRLGNAALTTLNTNVETTLAVHQCVGINTVLFDQIAEAQGWTQ